MTIVGWLDHCSATGVPLCLRLRARPPHRHQRPCLLMPPCHLAAAAATSLVSFILRLTAPLWSRRQWQKTFYLNIKRKNETFATTISEKVPVLGSVACESLDSREFLRLFFLNFTFILLSLLDLDFQSFLFHFHFSKRVKGKQISPFFSRKKSEI